MIELIVGQNTKVGKIEFTYGVAKTLMMRMLIIGLLVAKERL
jgi:hypothetical protein